jgi:hypothetical protein
MAWAAPYGVAGVYKCPRCGGDIVVYGRKVVRADVKRPLWFRFLRTMGMMVAMVVIVGALVGGVIFMRGVWKPEAKPPKGVQFTEMGVNREGRSVTVSVRLEERKPADLEKLATYYAEKYSDAHELSVYFFDGTASVNPDDLNGGSLEAMSFAWHRAFALYVKTFGDRRGSFYATGVQVRNCTYVPYDLGAQMRVVWHVAVSNPGDEKERVKVHMAASDGAHRYLKGTASAVITLEPGEEREVEAEMMMSKDMYERAAYWEAVAYPMQD